MPWVILIVAGVFEIGWVAALKRASDSGDWMYYGLTWALMLISVWLLSIAMRTLPMGTAYAVWTGIGAAGAALVGIALYSDSASLPRLACIGLIIAGVIGLKALEG